MVFRGLPLATLPAVTLAGLIISSAHSFTSGRAAGPAASEPDLGSVPAGALRDAARLAAPSVVSITTEISGTMSDTSGDNNARFDLAFGGTGFFASADGYVVTAAHVAAPTDEQIHLDFVDDRIDREQHCTRSTTDACRSVELQREPALVRTTRVANVAVSVHVVTQDMDASAVGLSATVAASSRSSDKDVAILKVDAHDAPVLLLRSSNIPLRAGMAVEGYPESKQDAPDPLVPTVTAGTVSDIRGGDPGFAAAAQVVETDAPIEHGNSGGPGVDDTGAVAGIVSYGPTTGPNYLVSAADITSVLRGTPASNALGRADSLWRGGLRARAGGDTATAARDFTDCAALASVQVGCRAEAESLGVAAPASADSGSATAATGADISGAQAVAWLGGGVAIGAAAGVAGTLLLMRSRSRTGAQVQPTAFHASGWGQPMQHGGWAWPGLPMVAPPPAAAPPVAYPPAASPAVRAAWVMPPPSTPATATPAVGWPQPWTPQPSWQPGATPPPPPPGWAPGPPPAAWSQAPHTAPEERPVGVPPPREGVAPPPAGVPALPGSVPPPPAGVPAPPADLPPPPPSP